MVREKRVEVRLAKPEEAEKIYEWSEPYIGDKSRFGFPTAKVFCSENGKPIQYMLVHVVAMWEGCAPNPDASDGELALGLKHLLDTLKAECQASGIKEIYALMGPDDIELELLALNNGWSELPYKVWRCRVG
jgi:hypothetical protein